MKTLAICFVLSILSATAVAQEEARQERSPWTQQLAVGFYATGHAGSYLAGGAGGRLRYEPFEWLGVEAYLEATIVDWPGGFRHDYPNGFSLYVPIRAGDFRFRPFLGFCDILSFIEPEQEHAPRADDILFGAHAGVGAEVAVQEHFSLFADLQANFYAGHDRSSGGWTGGVDEDLSFFWNLQLNIGVQAHVLDR
jgi:opacity protein-like surface antigen